MVQAMAPVFVATSNGDFINANNIVEIKGKGLGKDLKEMIYKSGNRNTGKTTIESCAVSTNELANKLDIRA